MLAGFSQHTRLRNMIPLLQQIFDEVSRSSTINVLH